jgi:hypothetical protein
MPVVAIGCAALLARGVGLLVGHVPVESSYEGLRIDAKECTVGRNTHH